MGKSFWEGITNFKVLTLPNFTYIDAQTYQITVIFLYHCDSECNIKSLHVFHRYTIWCIIRIWPDVPKIVEMQQFNL
jgi:hypothetical protein